MSSHQYYPFGLPGDGSAVDEDALVTQLVDDCMSRFPPQEPEQRSDASLCLHGEAAATSCREQTAHTGGRFEDSGNPRWQDTQAQRIFYPSQGGNLPLQTRLGPAVRPIGDIGDSQFHLGSSLIQQQHQDVHQTLSGQNERSIPNDIKNQQPNETDLGLTQQALPLSASVPGHAANASSGYGPLSISSKPTGADSSILRPWKDNGNLQVLRPRYIRRSEGSVSSSFLASDSASLTSPIPGYLHDGGNLEPGTPITQLTDRYLHLPFSSPRHRNASRGSHGSGNRKRRASSLSVGNVPRRSSRGGFPAGFRRANSQRSDRDHFQSDSHDNTHFWACPLAQKSGFYSHPCYGKAFTDVSRVKQHLKRDHDLEITPEQFEDIRVRMPIKEVESWHRIFRILFGNNEHLPSPFVNAQLDAQHRISSESLRDYQLSRVEDLDQMPSEQKEWVRRFIVETSFTFLNQASHDFQHDTKEPGAYSDSGTASQQQGNQGGVQHSSLSFEQQTEVYPSVLPDEVSRGGLLRGVGDENVILSGQDEQQLPFRNATGFNIEIPAVPANTIDPRSIPVYTNTTGDQEPDWQQPRAGTDTVVIDWPIAPS